MSLCSALNLSFLELFCSFISESSTGPLSTTLSVEQKTITSALSTDARLTGSGRPETADNISAPRLPPTPQVKGGGSLIGQPLRELAWRLGGRLQTLAYGCRT
ncbi:hypothetical protein AAFF_G00066050 [Aldrovandia affinis]|uniref:Secreted protein n=1 Tax=Aldrovandia affinis TaxID=143900 RepID=A0AAD7T581_9TELE|nr:hypothetical protein AAFF_G00066050 [Aldrovandia affinis]